MTLDIHATVSNRLLVIDRLHFTYFYCFVFHAPFEPNSGSTGNGQTWQMTPNIHEIHHLAICRCDLIPYFIYFDLFVVQALFEPGSGSTGSGQACKMALEIQEIGPKGLLASSRCDFIPPFIYFDAFVAYAPCVGHPEPALGEPT